jgi:CBS domain-containing protein
MSLASLMHPNPVTVRANQTVGEAVGVLVQHTFRSVPVLGPDGVMIGQFGLHAMLRMLVPRIATDPDGLTDLSFLRDDLPDLQRRLRGFWDKPVGQFAENDAPIVHLDTGLGEVVLALYRSHDSLPVVDRASGRLLGIVSYWDVVRRLVS